MEPQVGGPPSTLLLARPASPEVAARWGIIDLLDFLKESDHLTAFTDAFTTVATRENTPREVIRKRLLLVLYALGTNIGIKRVADGGRHGETEAALRATRHLFVNRDNLRNAIATLVNATLRMRDPAWWGTAPRAPVTPRSSGRGRRT